MIEVRDLRKNYGSFAALSGISFDVRRGEILGFLGPNGAGKTTAMKIMTGFILPSAGTVSIDGLDVVEHSLEVRRKIGYLPEHTPLYPDLTVTEYLEFCARLRDMPSWRASERIRAVIDMCSLGPKRANPIRTLSKGYRQRVGIAQALLHEPEVLILDEPTVGLDPNQVVPIREIIRDVGRERTVILCSHILSEVEAVSARVVIIAEGRIVGDGAPKDLAAQHLPGRDASLEDVFRALTAPRTGVAS
jgi:ABC-2 type transport system ATP-binding protein